MGLFDEIANRATGATDPNQRMSPAAERAMAANKNVREAVQKANERGSAVRQFEKDRGRDPDQTIMNQDETVDLFDKIEFTPSDMKSMQEQTPSFQAAKYGFLPSQQYKFSLGNILKDGSAFTNMMSMAKTIFGSEVVGQSMLEKFKTALDEGKDIQQVINNLTNKEYKEYIQLQSKLDNPEVTGAFLGNTLKIDGEDTGIPIQDLLEQTSEGIFSLDDPVIQGVQSQLANNPDLTFAQSLGFGTPDDFMSQVDALRALGPRAVESLKTLNPEKYYGTIEEGGFGFKPTTNQELESLSKMDIGAANAAGNKGLVNAIAAARMELRRNRNDGDRQAGIPSVVPPPVTPPPSAGPGKPIVPFPPPFMPNLPFPPELVQGAPPSIYSNFPQFNLSTYAQRGIADPNLSNYYQNLGRIA
tara:strand:+ start:993 stop:2237 length:1245 start_codon:yes stop_codon:yes gene_type:complete